MRTVFYYHLAEAAKRLPSTDYQLLFGEELLISQEMKGKRLMKIIV